MHKCWSDDCRSRLLTPTEEVDFIFGPGQLLMPLIPFSLFLGSAGLQAYLSKRATVGSSNAYSLYYSLVLYLLSFQGDLDPLATVKTLSLLRFEHLKLILENVITLSL